MKLSFSMDALDAAGKHAWRLQKDMLHWRSCSFAETMKDDDARLESPHEAESLNGRQMKKDKQTGLSLRGKPGLFDFLMRGIYSHAVLHRFSPAPRPAKAQMLDLIKRLEPGTPWLVYLDMAAHFRVLDSNREPIIGNLAIAVRGEIASSPAYIGPEAAQNDALMDALWRQFLGGWLEHLKTSQMAIFVPDVEKLKSEEEYRTLIDACPHE